MIGHNEAAVADAIKDDEHASPALGAAPGRPFTAVEGERRIRSFVLREGRQTQAQQRAMTQAWPRFGVDYEGVPRDFDAEFGRAAKRVLEIGFGNGDALLHAASGDPARDYIGVEVHAPGVGRVLNAITTAGLSNLRVYRHDAVEVLENEFLPESLDEVRIWFPDPWHKKRHHKRRLVNPTFAALLASRLRSGGMLHLATDWRDYADQMWDVLDAHPRFRNRFGLLGACARPDWRLQTRFETRGIGLGHGVWDLLYDRVESESQSIVQTQQEI
ncbi:MAG: tRNA (guanosine(46)-N7)-methyltransferase TrmB [Lysobacteraceae bacterium]